MECYVYGDDLIDPSGALPTQTQTDTYKYVDLGGGTLQGKAGMTYIQNREERLGLKDGRMAW